MTTHVLFDFFGTLVDYSPSRTEQGYGQSYALLRQAGIDLDYEGFLALWSEVSAEFDLAAAQSHHEFSMLELGSTFFHRAGSSSGEAPVREFVETYVSEWNKGVRYFNGLGELLERLARQFTLAVITNTHDPGLVPRHLRSMGVAELFSHVTTSVELGIRKPASEIFFHTLRALEASSSQCVYVGDSFEADYVGARAAGIRPLLIDPASQAPVPKSSRLASIFELEARLAAA